MKGTGNGEQKTDYERLLVWQKARVICRDVYLISEEFPSVERFGLTSQIRRCAVSIPSNIAEGYGRFSKKSFSNFLKISLGSVYELETQLVLACDVGYIKNFDDIKVMTKDIKKMLMSLISKI
jgi:four helix bundle protein